MKKNILIIILSSLLIVFNAFLSFKVITLSKNYDNLQLSLNKKIDSLPHDIPSINYDTDIDGLKKENNNLKSSIVALNESLFILQNSTNTLETKLSSLKTESSNNSKAINNVKRDLDNLNSNSKANNYRTSSTWSSIVTDRGIEYATTYEFKDNGDFYVNDKKVGSYFDGSILLKDSNDQQYRAGNYYQIDNKMYINFYETDTDIYISSSFIECEKK